MFRKLLNKKGLRLLIRNPKQAINLVFIVFYFISAKLIVQFVPLKYYHKRFRKEEEVSLLEMQPYYREVRLIQRVKQLVPWKVTCLMESLVVQSYFKRYNYNLPIQLGVNNERPIQAHAWVFHDYCKCYSKINI